MKRLLLLGILSIIGNISMALAEGGQAGTIYEHKLAALTGGELDLRQFQGKVVLIVNTASKCGYTPQYKGLQELQSRYGNRGFTVLGVPSNDFGGQEPGDAQQIKNFCESKFDVSFPMTEKVTVKGEQKHALYKYLVTESPIEPGKEVSWNFEKFLVGPDGRIAARYKSAIEPTSNEIVSSIEKLLPPTSTN